jgi:hypothetical protein
VSAGVPAGPVREVPAAYVPRAEREQMLAGALAGVEMGEWDRVIARWMAGWDTPTVVTIVSLIVRAREAGPAR